MRGALGHRGSGRQERPHSGRPYADVGETAVDAWTDAAGVWDGAVFRAINKVGQVWGQGMTAKVPWDVVRTAAASAGIENLHSDDGTVPRVQAEASMCGE